MGSSTTREGMERTDQSSGTRGAKELFRGRGAELYLVVGEEESVMMQKGEFVLLLVKHASSPLAAVVAMVGDMQWPVGRDSLVLKGSDNRYSFSLPASLTFALAFKPDPPPASLNLLNLDHILREYSTFLDQAGTAEIVHEASQFWTRIARNVKPEESVLHAMLHRSLPVLVRESTSTSPELAQKIQQARRISAVEKLFVRSVGIGAINVATHVNLADADASGGGQAIAELVIASVDAVAKVVEAVETAGKTLFENARSSSMECIQRGYGKQEGKTVAEGFDAVGSLISSAWTLNKLGLRMLFQTIATIQSKSSRASSDSQLLRNVDVSRRLHLSSSSSSSSISSKLPSDLSLSQVKALPTLSHASSSYSLTVDSSSPQPQAGIIVDATHPQPGTILDVTRPESGNRAATALHEGVFRPPPLPPRSYGVTPAAPVAGTRPLGFRVYKPQPSLAQEAISNAPLHISCPLRPPAGPDRRTM